MTHDLHWLGPRLATVARLVPAGSRVADVAADHGRLARALLSSRSATAVVVTEATADRLARTARLLGETASDPRLALRAGRGLDPLSPDDRLDAVVLAGLGARTIQGILGSPARAGLGVGRWILQPTRDEAALRRELAALGLGLVDERLVEERGRFHFVLVAAPAAVAPPAADEDDLEVGPVLLRDRPPELRDYWESTRARLLRIVPTAGEGPVARAARRRLALAERVLRRLGALC